MLRVITIAILVASLGVAQAQPARTNAKPRVDSTFDFIHGSISHSIDATVDYFDHFFGDDILNDDNRSTHLTLRLGVRHDQRQGAILKRDIDLRLALPQLRNRVQIIADNSLDVGTLDDTRAYENSVQGSKTDTGLRYILQDTDRLRLNADAGIQIGDPIRLFGKLRARYTILLDPYELRLTERLLYYTHKGFGTDSEAELSRRFDDGTLVRARGIIEWREDENGITPRFSLARFAAIDNRSSWRAALRGAWPETPHTDSAIYAHDVTYRRRIHKHWLYFEITPGIEWLEHGNFGWNPFIALNLEINFNADELPNR